MIKPKKHGAPVRHHKTEGRNKKQHYFKINLYLRHPGQKIKYRVKHFRNMFWYTVWSFFVKKSFF